MSSGGAKADPTANSMARTALIGGNGQLGSDIVRMWPESPAGKRGEELIALTHAEFEELRSDSHHFAIYPGHEEPDVETVVARRKGYDIVRKGEGVPRKIAERTDPRGD